MRFVASPLIAQFFPSLVRLLQHSRQPHEDHHYRHLLLNLVVPLDGLTISRWSGLSSSAWAPLPPRPVARITPERPVIPLSMPATLRTRIVTPHAAQTPSLSHSSSASRNVDVVIPHALIVRPCALVSASFDVAVRYGLVVVRLRGVPIGRDGDDVPGVQQAGDEAEAAEGDVDEGVCGAEGALDPDRERGKDDG